MTPLNAPGSESRIGNRTETGGYTSAATHEADGDASTTAHLAEAAHAAVDKAAANLANAERALRDPHASAGIKISDISSHAQQVGSESLSSMNSYIERNPTRAVGIAFAAGYLLSVILKK